MLWIALAFPALPLDSFLRASPTAEPWAVAAGRSLIACNPAAHALGVRAGMPRSAAQALAPALRVRERDPALERATLEDAAAWAGRYTPAIALQAGPAQSLHGLLLEVSGSLRLFGGLAPILDGLQAGTQALGLQARLASAPSAHGAWLLVRALRGGTARAEPCAGMDALAQRLRALPVSALEADTGALAKVGVRTLGELLALPRASLARRYGPELAAELDRALGLRPDPRVFHVPPERFAAGLELPAEVENAQALVFAARRLLVQLEGFLAARGGGVQRLAFTLFHRDAQTVVELGLVRPARDAERFALLAREKLSAMKLRAPVRRIALEAGEITELVPHTATLLDEIHQPTGDWAALAERLRARLGEQAVSGLATRADHRPESAWDAVPVGAGIRAPAGTGAHATPAAHAAHIAQRPLWLLGTPRPLPESGHGPCLPARRRAANAAHAQSRPPAHPPEPPQEPSQETQEIQETHESGRLELMAGPERIEVGWWDGREAARDYFVARAPSGALFWIYSERYSKNAGWYLHGIFG